MSSIRKKAIDGLKVGDVFSVSREFGQTEVDQFAAVSRDYNPVHFDERFTAARGFNGPICHGLLVAGMISEIGGQIGWLASEMRFKYKKPVYFGDRIECEMEITDIDDRGRAAAVAQYRNQHGILVMKAFLKGILPGDREKEVMRAMVAEGDPTNPLKD